MAATFQQSDFPVLYRRQGSTLLTTKKGRRFVLPDYTLIPPAGLAPRGYRIRITAKLSAAAGFQATYTTLLSNGEVTLIQENQHVTMPTTGELRVEWTAEIPRSSFDIVTGGPSGSGLTVTDQQFELLGIIV